MGFSFQQKCLKVINDGPYQVWSKRIESFLGKDLKFNSASSSYRRNFDDRLLKTSVLLKTFEIPNASANESGIFLNKWFLFPFRGNLIN